MSGDYEDGACATGSGSRCRVNRQSDLALFYTVPSVFVVEQCHQLNVSLRNTSSGDIFKMRQYLSLVGQVAFRLGFGDGPFAVVLKSCPGTRCSCLPSSQRWAATREAAYPVLRAALPAAAQTGTVKQQ